MASACGLGGAVAADAVAGACRWSAKKWPDSLTLDTRRQSASVACFFACSCVSGKWEMWLQLVVRHTHTRTHTAMCVYVCVSAHLTVLHCCHVDFFPEQHFVCAGSSLCLFVVVVACCVCCVVTRESACVCVCAFLCVYFHILVCMHVVSAAMSLCKLPPLCRCRRCHRCRLVLSSFPCPPPQPTCRSTGPGPRSAPGPAPGSHFDSCCCCCCCCML